MSQTTTPARPVSSLAPDFKSTYTAYHSAPMDDDESSTLDWEAFPDGKTSETQPSSRPLLKMLIVELLCFSWVIPICYLLYLNFTGHIIGASAWCPKKDCWVDAFNLDPTVPLANLAKYAEHDRNMNNILLYVAKALEVWFVALAGCLIYLLVMLAAGSGVAIPIRLLTLSSDFADLLSIFDERLWRCVVSATTWAQRRVWGCLVVTGVLIGILSNLMGPATATLVMPRLQWIQTAEISQGYVLPELASNISGQPPSKDGFAFIDSNCSDAAAFEAHRYSCSSKWSIILDSWVSSGFAALLGPSGYFTRATSPQDGLTLTVNATETEASFMWWVPSRQVLHELDLDRFIVAQISSGATAGEIDISEQKFQEYAAYNNSQRLQLRRSGPILGIWPHIHTQHYWVTVDQNRSILCIPNYDMSSARQDDGEHTNFTKCIQTATSGGYGWGSLDQRTVSLGQSFVVNAPQDWSNDTIDASIVASVYGSGAAVLLPDGSLRASDDEMSLPEACLHEPILSDETCNWAHFFSGSYNHYSENNETRDVNIMIFEQYGGSNETISLVIDYVAWLGYTTYELDPYPHTNPLSLVQTPSLDASIKETTLPIDPMWILAAWAVDSEDGQIPANRTIAEMLHAMFYHLRTDENPSNFDIGAAFVSAIYWPLVQALSLLDYTWNDGPPAGNPRKLTLNAKILVWAYGFDTKTARLGGAVAIVGLDVAFLQLLLGLRDRRKRRSLTQIVSAALAHYPHDDFTDVGDHPTAQASTHFAVHDAESEIGGLRFHRVRSKT